MNVIPIEPKEVHVNTITEMSIDKLVAIAAIHQHPLYYCSGRYFSFEPYAQTEWQHQNASKGIHYFYSVTYTPGEMQFEDVFTHDSSGAKVPIVDLNQHTFWQQFFKAK